MICKKPCDFFNMEGVIKETIMERRGPSLDVLVNGERVVLATKWWWSVAENGGSDDELEPISTSEAHDGPVVDAECDDEEKASVSSDSSSESSENDM